MLPFLISAFVACSGTSSVVGPDAPDEEVISSVQVEPSEVEVAVGDTARLKVTGKNGKGKAVSLGKREVRWTSSDTTVASVDSTGLVRTLGDGVARINVELATPGHGGPPPRDSARVRSVAADSSGGGDGSGGDSGGDGSDGGSGGSGDDGTSGDSDGSASADTVIVSPGSLQLDVSQSTTLDASVEDADGQVLDVHVSWSSENPDVATVDSAGKVTAKASGTTRILASADSVAGGADVEVLASSPSPDAYDDFRAFPEAEGWGAEALMTCDRTHMQVLHVTNLQDSGAGSLRDAIERANASVLTVILFDVAGYIDLQSRIEIDSDDSCLYIAGQTAPGDGITVRAWDKQAFMFKSGPVTDIVIRYLRFRNGTKDPGFHGSAQGILMMTGERVVVDHVSLSWANDQLLSVSKSQWDWGELRNVTLQRLLLAEPLASSPVCYGAGGHKEAGSDGVPPIYEVQKLSYHHNAAIHCSHRAPTIGVHDAEVINNVVYNWNQAAMQQGRKVYVDYIGNYFKAGPMNPPLDADYGWEFSHQFSLNYPREGEPDGYRVIGNTNNIDGRAGPKIYLSGNVGPHNTSGDRDNWSMTSKYWKDEREGRPESYYDSVIYADVGKMPISVDGIRLRRTTPNPSSPIPVTIGSAFDAWSSLVEAEDVGASRRLACDGDWIQRADAVDKRVLAEARNGTGRANSSDIASQDEVGGFPELDPGVPCSDTDGDGMPDEFESRYGLDPDDPRDALDDPDGDGYTNLEEFLNSSVPR